MSGARRPVWRRLLLLLVNVPAPGTGLLAAARLRPALAWLAVAPVVLALLVASYALAPELNFPAYLAGMGVVVAAFPVSIAGSMVATWRSSAEVPQERPWWSRWYGLLLALLLSVVATNLLVEASRRFYRPFYLPAESMEPTLMRNDRFIASMRGVPAPARGQLALVRTGTGAIYVKRIAALPGDTIELAAGVVRLNGRPVPQRRLGTGPVRASGFAAEAVLLEERFPGERAPHRLYDLGPGEVDDMPAQRVRPGHVFLLGDNRDRSADSRVPREQMGLEQVALEDLVGRPLFFTLRADGRLGGSLSD